MCVVSKIGLQKVKCFTTGKVVVWKVTHSLSGISREWDANCCEFFVHMCVLSIFKEKKLGVSETKCDAMETKVVEFSVRSAR